MEIVVAALFSYCLPGCGKQGKIQLRSLLHVRPLQHVFAFDLDLRQAPSLVDEFKDRITVKPVSRA